MVTLAKRLSANGKLSFPEASIVLYSPYAISNQPSVSSVGFLVIIRTAPPVVLLPYKVPCGPFRTSTLSISYNLELLAICLDKKTPSTKVPTAGSRVDTDSSCPIPLMKYAAACGRPTLVTPTIPGTFLTKSIVFVTARRSISSDEKTWIEMGTSCKDSDLF